jgi:hypothetical protein
LAHFEGFTTKSQEKTQSLELERDIYREKERERKIQTLEHSLKGEKVSG